MELKEGLFYEKKEKNFVKCLLCPNYCCISPGNIGICGVRKNIQGVLYTLNYDKVSALALDPIEKKPLYKFYPGSSILSVGSVGCNLKCPFCQNHSIAREPIENVETHYIESKWLVHKALELIPKGNIGIAYTYNEPTVWYEYIFDTIKLAKAEGLLNVLVTNGYISKEPLLEILPYINAMNIDLKGFANDYYNDFIKGNVDAVKRTIELSCKKCHIEITTLVIPGINDSIAEIEEMAMWISSLSDDIPLHLSRFFPQYKMKNLSKTPIETLYELKAVAEKYLKFVYLGNV